MNPELRARLGPRVQVRVVDKFSGSSAAFFLRVDKGVFDQPVSLAQLLARCGVPLSKGKSSVERLLETGSAAIEIPLAPDDIQQRLAELGVEAEVVTA